MGQLIAGCLLIDIGNLALPGEVSEFEGHLAGHDLEMVRDHPRAGFQIMKDLGWTGTLSLHIPYQHHERQDGKGYPRGLHGANRAVRRTQEEFDSRLILPIAEVAAIADIYDAFLSDHPYRRALTVDAAVMLMRKMSGAALNAEMLQTFLSLLPTFHPGLDVELRGGAHDGARGVVVGQDFLKPDRPLVRLYRDGDGEVTDEMVNTALDEDVKIRSLSAGGKGRRSAA